MDWLFEKYVCGILKSAARHWGMTVQEQYHCSLDVHRRVMMRPDAVFLRRGETVLAADAKYKLSPNHGDVYQMLAYCHALGLPDGVRVYPDGETAPAGAISIRGPGDVRVHYLALDLTGGPARLEEQGESLVEQVEASLPLSRCAETASSAITNLGETV